MITQADWDRFDQLAEEALTGTSRAGRKSALFDVISEFVGDSSVWSEWVSISVLPNVRDYRITPAHGGMILRLVLVHDPNHIGMPALLPELEPPGAHIHFVWPQNINLTAKAYVIKQIILPTDKRDLPDAPHWLFPVYNRQLMDGLIGKMKNQKNKSWSDPLTAKYHLQRFRDGILVAKTAAMRSNLFGGQSWRYPLQGRISSQRGGISTPFPEPTSW